MDSTVRFAPSGRNPHTTTGLLSGDRCSPGVPSSGPEANGLSQQHQPWVKSVTRTRFSMPALLAAMIISPALADEPGDPMSLVPGASAIEAPVTESVEALVRRLGDDNFFIRQQAAADLDQLLADAATQHQLADELRALWLDPALPVEVRERLEPLIRGLPQAVRILPSQPAPERVAWWLEQLGSSQPSARMAAEAELDLLLEDARNPGPLLVAIQQRLCDPELGAADLARLEPMYQKVFGTWLAAPFDPAGLPAVDQQQAHAAVARLLEAIDQPGPEAAAAAQAAERELLFLLARDDGLALVRKAIEDALDVEKLSGRAFTKLRDLADWWRPALVAEIFSIDGDASSQQRRQSTAQYLYIGVPWRSPNQPDTGRASHFDYCDDERCRAVNGYTLTPGEYPVGVAFPHPDNSQRTIFHIVNLSTPRRRMAFDRQLAGSYLEIEDQERRLAEITRRTCEQFLAGKRQLTPETARMIPVLDPVEVSRFAGERFSRPIDDDWTPLDFIVDKEILQSLSRDGTPEALPGLMQGMESGRLAEISEDAPLDLAWAAALQIARRNESQAIDAWLGRQLKQDAPLTTNAEVGATAAAILIKRHHESVEDFDLEPVEPEPLIRQRLNPLVGYVFRNEEGRRRAIDWWRARGTRMAERRDEPGRAQ